MMPRPLDLLVAVVVLVGVGYLAMRRSPRSQDNKRQPEIHLMLDSLTQVIRAEVYRADSVSTMREQFELFRLRNFDLELNFVVKETWTAEGKLEVTPVVVSANSAYERERVQKIAFHFDVSSEVTGGSVSTGTGAASNPHPLPPKPD